MVHTHSEETVGGVISCITSLFIYHDIIVEHAVNSAFVVFNTVLGVLVGRAVRKYLESRKK